jgi:glycosyltransferase involved in cell wall biosynthesis
MNRNLPKISLITICRNAENSIEFAIKSVVAQNYQNLQYIVIDGKSSDSTLSIVKKYTNHIDTIVSESDRGISDAFNKGLKLATGSVVAILNADDTLAPGSLDKVAQEHLERPESIIYGDMIYRDPDTNLQSIVKPQIEKMKYEMSLYHIAAFIPKSVYNLIGEYNLNYKLAMDYDFFIRCMKSNVEFYYTPFAYGTMNKGGVSFKYWSNALREQAEIQVQHNLNSSFSIKFRLIKRLIKDKIIYSINKYHLNFLILLYLWTKSFLKKIRNKT